MNQDDNELPWERERQPSDYRKKLNGCTAVFIVLAAVIAVLSLVVSGACNVGLGGMRF